MKEGEPIGQEPLRGLIYEPFCFGSSWKIVANQMIPSFAYDAKDHDPETFYRIAHNTETGRFKLITQAELTRQRIKAQEGKRIDKKWRG